VKTALDVSIAMRLYWVMDGSEIGGSQHHSGTRCRGAVHPNTRQTPGRDAPKPKLLCDDRLTTNRIRASSRQHPDKHRHSDSSLSLLGGKAAGAQTRPDQRLVTAHCRFY
jgi:hypothetical protein